MKVAILSSFSYHYECLPFLLEIFKKLNIHHIDVYFQKDLLDHISFWNQFYTFNKYHYNKWNKSCYNINIKLSSNDPYFKDSNCISLLHRKDLIQNDNYNIVLNPTIIEQLPKNNLIYMFPIYNVHEVNYKKTCNSIVYIGNIDNINFFKSIDPFLKKNNLHLHIMSSSKCCLKKDNITIHNSPKQCAVSNMLKTTSYVLCRDISTQNNDLFSGMYALAINYEIPLICHQSIQKKYKFPAITYNTSLNELDVQSFDYQKIVNEIKEFKKTNLLKNCENMKNKLF